MKKDPLNWQEILDSYQQPWPKEVAWTVQRFGEWFALSFPDGRSFGINPDELRIVQLPSADCPLIPIKPLASDVTPV